MSPSLKLTYFDGKGRAEAARVTFAIGGVEFEDERLTGEQFAERKASLVSGALPQLEVDGKAVTQSAGIVRYAGKLSKIYPEDAFEALKCDEITGVLEDIMQTLMPTFYMGPEEKVAARKELVGPEGKTTRFIKVLEKVAGSPNPFLLGEKISTADVEIFCFLDFVKTGTLDGIEATYFDDYPNLSKVYDAVKSHPKVVEYYAAK
mmetsp:Transcript_12288/g.22803  ORF Transcript_12288/g.22803 Transcript_12288/m.22803 type:complete len:205 (+) Transcript_12288:48-662(+)